MCNKLSYNIIVKTKIISTILIFFVLFGLAKSSLAAVSLPWSTTFDCNDWTQPNTMNCDGMYMYGSWTCLSGTAVDQINSTGNYSGGAGGKGHIYYLGNGNENNSGSIGVNLNTGVGEFWMRAYTKYSPLITWSNLMWQKWFYITGNGTAIIPELGGGGGGHTNDFNIGTNVNNFITGYGWNYFGDGNWHCVEVHIARNTATSSPYNGVIQTWIDNVLVQDLSNANLGTSTTTWSTFHWGSNSNSLSSAGCLPVYYDDIAISSTGRIGPIETSPDITPPAAPSGLSVN